MHPAPAVVGYGSPGVPGGTRGSSKSSDRRCRVSDCLFCKIAAKSVPAALVHEDADVVAFDDIHPQAPVHVMGGRPMYWPPG